VAGGRRTKREVHIDIQEVHSPGNWMPPWFAEIDCVCNWKKARGLSAAPCANRWTSGGRFLAARESKYALPAAFETARKIARK